MRFFSAFVKACAILGVLDFDTHENPLNNRKVPFSDEIEADDPEYNLKLLEIQSVAIHQDDDPDNRKIELVPHDKITDKHDYYVAFTRIHPDTTSTMGNIDTATSLCLAINGEPANVNAHVDPVLKEDIYCEIYRREKVFPDRKIGTVTFSPDELQHPQKRSSVEKVIIDRKTGTETKATLKLDLIKKNWKNVYGTLTTEFGDKKIDKFFALSSKAFAVMIRDTNNPTANQLERPTKQADPNLEMNIYLDGMLQFPKFGEFVSVDRQIMWGMNLLNKLPFPDRQTPFKSRADGMHFIRRELVRHCIPEPPEGRWRNPLRDESMKRVYFSSLGQLLLRKMRPDEQVGSYEGCVYEADSTWLTLLKYRGQEEKKFEPLGCRTYFDKHGDIVSIEELDGTVYRPGDEHWEWAKLKSRSSAFTHSALIHLVESHYIWGNIPGMALRMFLPPDHPIRQAFTVHFWKTAYTCSQSQWALFDEVGLLARGLSMHYYGGLESTFIKLFKEFKFSHFPDDLKNAGMDQCEFSIGAKDGVELQAIMMQYVSDYLDEVYGGDQSMLDADEPMRHCWEFLVDKLKIENKELTIENLKKVFGEILFRVTGHHQALGANQQYALDPSFNDVRMMPKERGVNALVGTHESVIGVALIVAMTTLPAPTLSQDWSQVFDKPSLAYAKLKVNLKELGKQIDSRNKKRFPCLDYHPDYVTLSISA